MVDESSLCSSKLENILCSLFCTYFLLDGMILIYEDTKHNL